MFAKILALMSLFFQAPFHQQRELRGSGVCAVVPQHQDWAPNDGQDWVSDLSDEQPLQPPLTGLQQGRVRVMENDKEGKTVHISHSWRLLHLRPETEIKTRVVGQFP